MRHNTFRALLKDPLLTMILYAPNETKDKGNLGQKRLSDNTKVDFGAKKDHGSQWVFKGGDASRF